MYYEIHGDPDHPQTVLLSAGLGGSHRYWAPQIEQLVRQFRVIVYDHFATGQSHGDIAAGYTVSDMAGEVAQILQQTATEQVHFIGHALGGLIGLQLALDQPQKVASLMIVNGWDKTSAHTLRCFAIRKALLKHAGPELYLQAQPLFLYPSQWISQHSARLDEELGHLLSSEFNQDNLLARIHAIEAFDLSQQVCAIQCPCAVVATMDDLLVPYSCSQELQQKLPHSSLYLLERGGHACNITQPERFAQVLSQFYTQVTSRCCSSENGFALRQGTDLNT